MDQSETIAMPSLEIEPQSPTRTVKSTEKKQDHEASTPLTPTTPKPKSATSLGQNPYFKSIKKIMKVNKSYEDAAKKSIDKYKRLKAMYNDAALKIKATNELVLQLKLNNQTYEKKVKDLETASAIHQEQNKKYEELKSLYEDTTVKLGNAENFLNQLRNELDQRGAHIKDQETRYEVLKSIATQERELLKGEKEEMETVMNILKDSLSNEEQLRTQLLVEIENQAEEQEKETKEYAKQLKEKETEVIQVNQEKAALEEERNNLENSLKTENNLKNDLLKVEAKLEEEVQTRTKENEQLLDKITALKQTHEEYKAQIEELTNKTETLSENIDVKESELETMRLSTQGEIEASKISHQEELETVAKAHQELRENHKEETEELKKSHEVEVEDFTRVHKDEMESKNKEIESLTNDLSSIHETIYEISEKLNLKMSESEMHECKTEDLISSILELQNQYEESTKQIEVLNTSIEELNATNENEIAELKEEYNDHVEKLENNLSEEVGIKNNMKVQIEGMVETMQVSSEQFATETAKNQTTISEMEQKMKERNDQITEHETTIVKFKMSLKEEQGLRAAVTEDLENIQKEVVTEIGKYEEEMTDLKQKLKEALNEKQEMSDKLINDVIKYEGIIARVEKESRQHRATVTMLEKEISNAGERPRMNFRSSYRYNETSR